MLWILYLSTVSQPFHSHPTWKKSILWLRDKHCILIYEVGCMGTKIEWIINNEKSTCTPVRGVKWTIPREIRPRENFSDWPARALSLATFHWSPALFLWSRRQNKYFLLLSRCRRHRAWPQRARNKRGVVGSDHVGEKVVIHSCSSQKL